MGSVWKGERGERALISQNHGVLSHYVDLHVRSCPLLLPCILSLPISSKKMWRWERGPLWILLCWQRKGFHSSLGLLCRERRTMWFHVWSWCSLAFLFTRLLPGSSGCWDYVQTERETAGCRLQPFRLSTSLAFLGHSHTAAATRVTPEERGLAWNGQVLCAGELWLSILIMHSLRNMGRRAIFTPMVFHSQN